MNNTQNGRGALGLRAILALVLLATTTQVITSGTSFAQTNAITFPLTGMMLQGKFLDYWNAHGGIDQQGYPISDEFQEVSPVDGKTYTVQYFERAEFEMHPENPAPNDVLLSLLGVSAYNRRYPVSAPGQVADTSPGTVNFPETGHSLGGRFLDYWNNNGGLAQQGYPISDEFQEVSPVDGKTYTVQYFERAEFEMHPENPAPYDVLLALLGSLQYNRQYPQESIQPIQPVPTTTEEPPTVTATVTATVTITPTTLPASTEGDWPMYGHDPQHTGYNPDETLINADNADKLVQRWQVFLGSNGKPASSTPGVANGRIYVGSSVPSGPNFFALDAQTGTQVWSADLGYLADCVGVGIGSSPAISGTVVAVGGGVADYFGLDANTGATLWRNDLNVGPSGFAWVSPLLYDGRAYLGIASYCDNPSVRGEVREVEMNTGDLVAHQYIVPEGKAGGGIWNSPALSPDGKVLAVTTGEDFDFDGFFNRAMLTLDPLTLDAMQVDKEGSTHDDEDFGSSPVFFHDKDNRLLVGATHKDGDFYAYEVDNVSKGPIWSRPGGYQVGMLPAYDPNLGDGGTLFLTGSDALLHALDPATGAELRPATKVGQLHGNLAIANGLIFVDAGVGGLEIMNESDGQLLRNIVPPNAGKGYTGVVVSHGFIYWVSGGYLNAWSLPQP